MVGGHAGCGQGAAASAGDWPVVVQVGDAQAAARPARAGQRRRSPPRVPGIGIRGPSSVRAHRARVAWAGGSAGGERAARGVAVVSEAGPPRPPRSPRDRAVRPRRRASAISGQRPGHRALPGVQPSADDGDRRVRGPSRGDQAPRLVTARPDRPISRTSVASGGAERAASSALPAPACALATTTEVVIAPVRHRDAGCRGHADRRRHARHHLDGNAVRGGSAGPPRRRGPGRTGRHPSAGRRCDRAGRCSTSRRLIWCLRDRVVPGGLAHVDHLDLGSRWPARAVAPEPVGDHHVGTCQPLPGPATVSRPGSPGPPPTSTTRPTRQRGRSAAASGSRPSPEAGAASRGGRSRCGRHGPGLGRRRPETATWHAVGSVRDRRDVCSADAAARRRARTRCRSRVGLRGDRRVHRRVAGRVDQPPPAARRGLGRRRPGRRRRSGAIRRSTTVAMGVIRLRSDDLGAGAGSDRVGERCGRGPGRASRAAQVGEPAATRSPRSCAHSCGHHVHRAAATSRPATRRAATGRRRRPARRGRTGPAAVGTGRDRCPAPSGPIRPGRGPPNGPNRPRRAPPTGPHRLGRAPPTGPQGPRRPRDCAAMCPGRCQPPARPVTPSPDQAGRHGGAGLVVDEQERPARRGSARTASTRDGLGEPDPDLADVVELEPLGVLARFEGVHVQPGVDALDERPHGAGARSAAAAAAAAPAAARPSTVTVAGRVARRSGASPRRRSGRRARRRRRRPGAASPTARRGPWPAPRRRCRSLDRGADARRRMTTSSPTPDDAGGDLSGVAAVVGVLGGARPDHVLDGEPQRRSAATSAPTGTDSRCSIRVGPS